jgi:hypothetical protein
MIIVPPGPALPRASGSAASWVGPIRPQYVVPSLLVASEFVTSATLHSKTASSSAFCRLLALVTISEDPVKSDTASGPQHVFPGLQLALATGAAISDPAAASANYRSAMKC